MLKLWLSPHLLLHIFCRLLRRPLLLSFLIRPILIPVQTQIIHLFDRQAMFLVACVRYHEGVIVGINYVQGMEILVILVMAFNQLLFYGLMFIVLCPIEILIILYHVLLMLSCQLWESNFIKGLQIVFGSSLIRLWWITWMGEDPLSCIVNKYLVEVWSFESNASSGQLESSLLKLI